MLKALCERASYIWYCVVVGFRLFFVFKTSAVLRLIVVLLYLATEIIAVTAYYSDTESVAGWSQGEYLILIGSIQMAFGLYNTFSMNAHDQFPYRVLVGEFDFDLLRPIGSFWISAFKEIDIPSLLSIVGSGITVLVGVHLSSISPGAIELLTFGGLIVLVTAFLFYSHQLFLTLTFWSDSSTGLLSLTRGVVEFSSVAKEVFPQPLRFALTRLFPIALVTNLPADFLRDRNEALDLSIALGFVVLLAVVTRVLWSKGTFRYGSAA